MPLPLLVFLGAAAAAVAVSFLLILPTRVPALAGAGADRVAVRRVPVTAGLAGVLIVALLCWAGLAGSQEIPENILPTLFWVYLWVVVPLLCGPIGDFTSGSNPFGFLAQLGDALRARTGRTEPLGWPSWLGWWPAVVLAGAGTLAELVFNNVTTLPRVIAWIVIVYSALCLAMGAVFGPSAWRERGELFSVLLAT